VLARRPQRATIKFVWFTGEEAGLRGSREFVRRAVEAKERVRGALNNDMLGWMNDNRLDNTIRYSNAGLRDVQHALHAGLSPRNKGLRDRGVKKAPFVVLIGANMPSILAEISFVSNPTDEKKLMTPDYRQKIAESLYRGMAKYVSGLAGVKVAAKLPAKEKEDGQP